MDSGEKETKYLQCRSCGKIIYYGYPTAGDIQCPNCGYSNKRADYSFLTFNQLKLLTESMLFMERIDQKEKSSE